VSENLEVGAGPADLCALSVRLQDAEAKRKDAEATAKGLKELEDKLERELLDSMLDAGVKSFRREDGIQVLRSTTIYSKVTDKSALVQALQDEGLSEYLELEPRKARLNEWVREQLEKGERLLPGLDFSATTYASFRK